MKIIVIFLYLFLIFETNSNGKSDDYHWEGFNQKILKSYPSSKQDKIDTANKDRKRLNHLIIQAKALNSTGKSRLELYFTKSNLQFFSFIDKRIHYLIIKPALFRKDWNYNFYDELSKKFLGDIGIHNGIESLAMEVYEHKEFKNILEENAKYAISIPFTIIGHSLGGAVAIPLAKKLQNAGYKIGEVTTFGQPKITDSQGALKLNNLPILRVTLESDLLSRLPLNNTTYKHVGRNLKLSEFSQFFYPDSIHDNMNDRSEKQMNQLEVIMAAQTKIEVSHTISGLALIVSKLEGPNIYGNLESAIICHNPPEYIYIMQKHHTILQKYKRSKLEFPGRRVGTGGR